MAIGLGILFIAAGAILRFAVTAAVTGVDLATVGVILMIIGGLGIVLSFLFWDAWGSWGGMRRRRRTEVIETPGPDYAGAGRRVVRDDERY